MNQLTKNTTALSVAGVVSKIFGAVYKFSLIKILTQEGLGIYSITYPIFAIFLILGTSSLPLGISKYVSKYYGNVKLKQILTLSIIISGIGSIILYIFAKKIAILQGHIEYIKLYYTMLPIIVMSFVLGSFKGYFQGIEQMKIVAKSQIIEQLLKIVFGILLCVMLPQKDLIFKVMMLFVGIGVGEFFTIIWLYVVYKKREHTTNGSYKELLKTITPICITTIILPLSQTIISIIILPLINYFNLTFATKIYGIASGMVSSIVSIPLIITSSLSVAILPNISKNGNSTKENVSKSIEMVFIFSTLFVIIFSMFASEISNTLINVFKIGDIDENVLANLFKFSSFTIFFSSFLQVLNSILSGIGKSYNSAMCIFVGAFIKIILVAVLSRIQEINIYSIFLAESVGYGVCVIMQLLFLRKYNMYKLDVKNALIKPTIINCSIIMTINLLKRILDITFLTTIIKGVAFILVGGIFYLICYLPKIKLIKKNKTTQIKSVK